LENIAKGVSRVRFSFHMATGRDGTPEALAADILDDDNPLGSDPAKERRFCLMLAGSAWAHGLNTGTLWGLGHADRAEVIAAVAGKDWEANVGLGWDAGHVEVKGITPAKAKRGQRPPA
jgi:hypothetical protein